MSALLFCIPVVLYGKFESIVYSTLSILYIKGIHINIYDLYIKYLIINISIYLLYYYICIYIIIMIKEMQFIDKPGGSRPVRKNILDYATK